MNKNYCFLRDRFCFRVLFCIFLFFISTSIQAEIITSDEKNNVDVFKKAQSSVVYITNTQIRRDYFSLNIYEIPKGTGSGFIWNKSGYIVTNFHVIQNADKVKVTLKDHSTWEANVVGIAPDKDLAVLKIKAPGKKFSPIIPAESNSLEVGRKVLAIGNPFGLDHTLTVGVVSALGREINSVSGRKIKGVIQTDAAINPGNSGGPLLNSSAKLVGVNTAIYSPSGSSAGIGFAIPVKIVKKVVPQLIKYGREIKPVVGVNFAEDSIAREYGIEGVIVINTIPGYPAYQAGIRGIRQDYRGNLLLGDIIIAVNNAKVKNSDDFISEIESYKPGDKIQLTTIRGRKLKKFILRLASPK